MLTVDRRQPYFIKLTSGFREVARDSKIRFPPLTLNYCNSNNCPTYFKNRKIKASLTGALTDYFMQCSDFCHVYKGIVSYRLSVTLSIATLNHTPG